MASKDAPKIHLTLTKLKEETKAAPDAFKVGLSGGKVVTFPDFYGDMPAEESEALLEALNDQRRVSVWPALKLWLSEADVKKLQGEKFSLHQLIKILSAASAHYENHYGSVGERNASDD